uniref:Ricin B-type lectin domain-containing protein n=1 Tax=Caenorhabditis tropicalis TaxID=1561998 RepID=A0A1I7U4I8_9PELO
MELLDNSNWDYIMYYYHRPLTRSYSKPIVTLDENSCVTDYNCPVYWDVFLDFEIAVRPPNYDNTIKFQCDADTRKWNVTYLDEPVRPKPQKLAYITCVEVVVPQTTPPPIQDCKCKREREGLNQRQNNFLMRSQMSEDECLWLMTCKGNGRLYVKINGEEILMDQMLAECSIDTNQWSIISSDKQSWTQIDELDYSCYDS